MTDSSIAPTASFDIQIRKDVPTQYGNLSYMTIQETTGDKIHTKDLKIITINPNAAGNNKTREILPNVINTKSYSYTGVTPFWNLGNFPKTGQFFGEFVLEPGMTLVADEYANYDSDAVWDEDEGAYSVDGKAIEGLAQGMTGMQAMFADWGDDPGDPSDDTIHSGDMVTVKIVHMPSNKVIFQQDVVVI
jgi:hypothetical protein